MKSRSLFIFLISISLCTIVNAQVSKPVFSFKENSGSHNTHIASDGEYYYTVNGGRSENGRINKFNLKGELISGYDFKLDMRSIMYSTKDKNLYINCYDDNNLYKIINLETGIYEVMYKNVYINDQASLTLGTKGKFLYSFNKGDLDIYKFSTGKRIKTLTGFNCGEGFMGGDAVAAVDSKYIYTWGVYKKTVYIYTLKGKEVKTVELSDGNYGSSLSYANGYIFVSVDGNNNVGTWYAYDLWAK